MPSRYSRSLPLSAVLCLGTLLSAYPVFAQQTPAPQTPQPGRIPGRQRGGAQGVPPGGAPPFGVPSSAVIAKPRPYSEVITDKAITDKGLFTTHRIDDRYFFEIPIAQLGKELLWVTTFRQTQTGYGYGGTEVQNRVVRWEKRGDKILLRAVDYQMRADTEGTMKRALALANVEPILMTFDVKAYNDKENNAPVIDVTPLFVSDPAEFSPRRQLGPTARLDASRTFVDRVKALPQNIEMDVLATYALTPGLPAGPGGGLPGRRTPPDGPQRDPRVEAVTVVLHHSIVSLPDRPMKPRLYDDRVGFFTTGFYEFGNPENRVKEVQYARRWRLEKKDPTAAVSEPIKPITYYVGPEVPAKWRPFIKQGIEDWQPAFEAAGFKNGIVAKDAPTPEEDPQFDVDDLRYSVIRWLPSAIENAYGPNVVDPRTGEILNANIKVYHNVLKLAETWYFTQASPNDPQAHKLPLPDALMGQLIRYVVSHEVGHTLGLRHNMKASSSFSVAQLRDPKWTAQWGDESSIMDYGRFNYVAQPGDGARLIPKQGPYDMFAIEWGYKPLPNDNTPSDEKADLDKIASRQATNPMLRFGGGGEDSLTRDDPTQQSEDLGSDPIAATRFGLKNLDRVMTYIVSATERPGEDYDRLREAYDSVFSQRSLELDHVAVLVGGMVQTNNHYGENSKQPEIYVPTPAAKQRDAVAFLVQNAFATPTTLIQPDILSRIEPAAAADRVLAQQARVLARLMSDTRLKRVVDVEAQPGTKGVYRLDELMDDVRKGIWSELSAPGSKVTIDPYRRNLQRTYITLLGAKLATGAETPSEVRPAVRGVLMDTKTAIKTALGRPMDRPTRQHLVDANETLQLILYPKGS